MLNDREGTEDEAGCHIRHDFHEKTNARHKWILHWKRILSSWYVKKKDDWFFYRMKDWIEERELSDEFIAWTMDKYGVFGTTFL